jgi:urea carboxylase
VFEKVLVANRGEIACRIISTLQRLGIGSVVVYSEADAATLPVRLADEAICIGPAPAAASYLNAHAILSAALECGAQAVHPGYGFLAERADFAERVEAAGLVFIGPTPEQLRVFGAKHSARRQAERANVPLLPGSAVLGSLEDATCAAERVGYPIVVKATAGGGGIGMRVCNDASELRRHFEGVQRQAGAAFGDERVYLERWLRNARHIEVQIVGDGLGRVVTLGDRDCSTQRRNQKVLEETPAPLLPDAVRARLLGAAQRLAKSVEYRSAGTVEFLVDIETETIAFLEVNARLQVEHTVTESVLGIDLVEWMIAIAAGNTGVLETHLQPRGHAIEARICAENPWRGHEPSAGTLATVKFPDDARVDTWIESGTEVTANYDSLLAKIVVHAENRADALDKMRAALAATRIDGVATNVDLLRAVVANAEFTNGRLSTALLNDVEPAGRAIEVLSGGTLTTVQDHPGRLGYWAVGVPPSGPMDDLSFRIGNRIVGNPDGCSGLELTANGPRLLFHMPATVCIAGAPCEADIDGSGVPMWERVAIADGETLTIGVIGAPGVRAYLLVAGGIDVAPVLGSASTFTLGGFGGHAGRALRTGDVLRLRGTDDDNRPHEIASASDLQLPEITDAWEIAVLAGPHGDREFLTDDDIAAFYGAEWRVHHNSARTGVRLIGPTPTWARADGGDAGLHPSNIHDTAYSVGSIDFTGNLPIILGPDGPSLGGFVCPAVVVAGDRWKLGQLRPEATVRFVPVDDATADARRRATTDARRAPALVGHAPDGGGGLLGTWEPEGSRPAVRWRRSGEDYLLVEYGPMVLDLELRFRVHALQQWLEASAPGGVLDVTPGIRSLQVHFDPDVVSARSMLAALQSAEPDLPDARDAVVERRIVHLPLSWDDPATREAIHRYMSTVRADAPWCPWNIEFIRRINGLASVDDVKRIVYDASYLVLGLGDVYLGAPVATPLDPRHRLVTTKYNPARTWTPENAVGIGGAYLCIYGMEGPGGYQFVGRTVPVWNRFRRTKDFSEPWLLRFFDSLRFFEVEADELTQWRRDVLTGRAEIRIEPSTLRLADHFEFVRTNESEIAAFRDRQQRAFNEERSRWAEAEAVPATDVVPDASGEAPLPTGATVVEAALLASVWKVVVEVGQRVCAGDPLVVLESMKMETTIAAPVGGAVARVMVRSGQDVVPGQPLVALT